MPKKKKEPQPSDLANTLAEHLTNVRKLVLDADTLAEHLTNVRKLVLDTDELVHQAIQEVNAIKRLLSKETDK